jgi:hypothetical protein
MAKHANKPKTKIDKFSIIDIDACKRFANQNQKHQTVEEFLENGGKIKKDKRIRGRQEKQYVK